MIMMYPILHKHGKTSSNITNNKSSAEIPIQEQIIQKEEGFSSGTNSYLLDAVARIHALEIYRRAAYLDWLEGGQRMPASYSVHANALASKGKNKANTKHKVSIATKRAVPAFWRRSRHGQCPPCSTRQVPFIFIIFKDSRYILCRRARGIFFLSK